MDGPTLPLPATYILTRAHVTETLCEQPVGATLVIHPTTLGIEDQYCCSYYNNSAIMLGMKRIIINHDPPSRVPPAAVLGALVTRIGMYEPDLVDIIRGFVDHQSACIGRVGAYAFANTNLEYAELPDTIRAIDYRAFSLCMNLTAVKLPRALTFLGDEAFVNCSLTEITLPDTLTKIHQGAFESCVHLTTVKLPSKLSYIGSNAFKYCSSLTEIILPDTLTVIGYRVFAHCESLRKVTLPNTLTRIEEGAFEYCSALTDIEFPDTLEDIFAYAFYKCDSLRKVILPSTFMGKNIFASHTMCVYRMHLC